ncbi:MAG: Potassium-transporting ATPase A chain [Candidatus Accumulibacter phosphatis]|uniref:Potassium-transporting ATPase potassium-binding subunit n=1 Tax=Candidatus Accumulibacter phosphatis TaxID=327160 RepID=A0A080LR54_9PROT|nr:potassium-transporting ATPase subunit KdpA [Accumulibacter sp.]KFB70573.1 MAG: Potassium-transporting ATPase A chain [Candidatus Accumulibacter phosphatis]MBL8406316.1 potassium-transporting ATPase subunit KdpA [Accumulibacter sp.]HRF13624.1 potassium-transporting ATPase subunit KdpA [Candidatus Accumulibacter phosphatis]
MSNHAWLLLGLYLGILLLLVRPLGIYIARVMMMENRVTLVTRFEDTLFRMCGIERKEDMGWLKYSFAVLLFNALGLLTVYALQRLQVWLPLNPQAMANVSPDSAFNTAVSFVTNTNWQGYGGESTMGYLTQMLGLTVQNFLSAATGIVVVIALIRGFVRHVSAGIGNAWVDLLRVTLWILLPLSSLFALFLASQGVIQNFAAYQDVSTLEVTKYDNPKLDAAAQPLRDEKGNAITEPATTSTQTLPMGPVASQEAIKMIGTNGGGFFNANSAHPFENPTPLVNFVQMLSIFLIPGALCIAFGCIVGDERQGWTVLAAMTVLFVTFAIAAICFEQQGNPLLAKVATGDTLVSTTALADGNMEGKETRFGIADSALFATITTAASCGAVNSMHDSFTPLGGLVPLVNMQLGEVVFGGVGSGLYGMLVFAVLAVFIAGLMIGRTPEYLGKKIESHEMKMTSIAILVTPLLVLVGTAIAVMTEAGRAGIANPGAHGFSEILYALSSAANNNGSAFAGLSANTPFYNVLLAVAMWFGRFGVILPVLAMAGSLAAKKRVAATAGTLPTHGPLFVTLLIGSVLLVGLLNYVPALALGPLVEHLVLWPAR